MKVNGIFIIFIEKCSFLKQTDTTQRWKFILNCSGHEVSLKTKIEFSRRGFSGIPVFEQVNPVICSEYPLSQILAPHYDAQTAFNQKVSALATRTITQARDIFDIGLLFSAGASAANSDNQTKKLFRKAMENAISVSFKTFKSQVLSYLHPDYQKIYDSEEYWTNLVLKIADELEKEAIE